MINTEKIISIIENFAPLELAEDWDNTGWQINLGKSEVNNILICLSLTPKILQQAIENQCDLIISHHPLIFNPTKKIENKTVTQNLIINCIKNGIQVYSAHTNLDCTQGGVNDTLCEKLGLINISDYDKFVKFAELPATMSLDNFVLKLKIALDSSKVKIINPDNIQKIKKVALCSGSGGEFITDIDGVDAYITGDIKYHTALEVKNMVVFDAGHFETEKLILQKLKNLISSYAPDTIIANETEPWVIA